MKQHQVSAEPKLRHRVLDPGRALDLIDQHLVKPAGTQNAAARLLGMNRGQFSKVLAQMGKEKAKTVHRRKKWPAKKKRTPRKKRATSYRFIYRSTLDRLCEAMPPRARDLLREAIVPVRALREYEIWISTALEHFGAGEMGTPGRGTPSPWNAVTALALVRALETSPYAGHFTSFDKEVVARWGKFPRESERSRRILLAKCRAVAPLLEWRATGGIERQPGELVGRDGRKAGEPAKPDELGPYLTAALRAESILLNRAYATHRLHRVSSAAKVALEWLGPKGETR